MRIRTRTVSDNVQGRAGTQFQSPFTNQVYYASVEHGTLYLRHYDGHELGKEEGIEVQAVQVTAHFAEWGKVVVTLSGYHPGTSDSAMDTHILSMEE